LDVADAIKSFFDADVPIKVTGEFRVGDIRHSVADISRIQALAGFKPQWQFAEGLKEFLGWAATLEAAETGFAETLSELKQRGLFGAVRSF
jgi:dTDP-L-rhamnose 4-epimerase